MIVIISGITFLLQPNRDNGHLIITLNLAKKNPQCQIFSNVFDRENKKSGNIRTLAKPM